MDLSRIGKGQNVVVLVHDHRVANSYELMRALDDLRQEYHRHINFLVADLNTSSGQKFAAEQGVEPASLVLFAADGNRLLTVYGPKSHENLRLTFDRTFGHRTARR
jgi:thioredoxin-like negative regulator of GroEL